MKFLNKAFLTIACLSSVQLSIAQRNSDTSLSDQKINIYREYVPEVYLPTKPSLSPSDIHLETTDKPNLNYDVPPQTLQYNYGAISLRPLSLQPAPEESTYQNYAAIGLGNYSTILADLGLTYHEDGKYDATIHAYHFSQKGGKIKDRQSSSTKVSVAGKYFLQKYVLQGNVQYHRRGLTYYGYNHYDYAFEKNDILQAYNTIEANLGLEQFSVTEHQLAVQPQVNLYTHTAKMGGTEMGIGANVPISYNISERFTATVGLQGLATTFEHDDTFKRSNSFFQLNPSLQYSTDKLWLQVGISPVKGTNSDWTILPNIKARYAIGELSRAAVSAGWDGEVVMYTFKNLTERNPFTYIPNTGNAYRKRIYAGLELAPLSNLKIEGKVSYNRFNRYANFYNDYSIHTAGNFFSNRYLQDLEVFQTYIAAHVLISNQFDLGAHMIFNNFSKNDKYILHEPKMELGAYMKVKPIPQLSFGANLALLSGIKYMNAMNERASINAAFDLGLNAQYEFLDRYAVSINLDNIMDSKYQRWNQYPVYGFNIFGGLKVKF